MTRNELRGQSVQCANDPAARTEKEEQGGPPMYRAAILSVLYLLAMTTLVSAYAFAAA